MVSRGKGNNKDSKPPSLKKCKIPLDKINLLCYNKDTKKKGNKKMNVIKMFWMMLVSLRYYFKAEDKEAFWEWYWEQVPNSQYPNETLWETWENFKFYITGQHIIFNVRMWWESRFNRKNFGYSHTFGKNGYFINHNKWFVPCDKSFSYGCVDEMTEYRNGNPYFAES